MEYSGLVLPADHGQLQGLLGVVSTDEDDSSEEEEEVSSVYEEMDE